MFVVFHGCVLFVGRRRRRRCHVRLELYSVLDARAADRVAALLVFKPERSIVAAEHACGLAEADAAGPHRLQRALEILVALRIDRALSLLRGRLRGGRRRRCGGGA